jgi:hypothetical protein
MSRVLISSFTKYEQTEAEVLTATNLSPETKQFIQNQIVLASENRLALTPDPNNYAAFIQEEAYLKGQVAILKYLLDCSENAEQTLRDAKEAQS